MADCLHFSHGNEQMYTSLGKQLNEVTINSRSIKGLLTRYILNTKTLIDGGERLKRERFGKEDERKPHKTILLVGETGTGKLTLINAMLNYMLGVKWEDRVWCEIIETKGDQTETQTSAVTVYDVFVEESPFSLTVIDTPGYGSTGGTENDFKIAETLHELFRSRDGVHEIDAVCLVVKADTTRLTETQLYVFDAILSLFGFDVERNIVLLITHSTKKPTNTLRAIKESKVKCAKTSDGKPVYFSFNNFHCAEFQQEEEDETDYEAEYQSYRAPWVKNEETLNKFFVFLNNVNPINLSLTESVLRKRKQLKAAINNLKDQITLIELRKDELKQTKAALEQYEKEKKDMNNFEYEVDEPYKVKVPIDSKWWHLTKEATCCRVCEENCHFPGCWWVRDLSQCSVMSDGKCTVCTGKCDYTLHVKEGKIYELKTWKVKKTIKDLKKKYEKKSGEKMSLMSRLENELRENEREKARLVEECYQCVVTLDEIALKPIAGSTLQHLDFLIEKVKETRKTERVLKLEELKRRAEAKKTQDCWDA
ncbi:uncharacterized protein LOC118802357 [Colossoma macropomum]|uniref:uncharacterized protein LOC118802357 n=1 Tax=Colossoma macropomum TaxID=42526 RepID=UPI0018653629|nr:uncharacterized protein LOC118802357 [Colossoma macropomum]